MECDGYNGVAKNYSNRVPKIVAVEIAVLAWAYAEDPIPEMRDAPPRNIAHRLNIVRRTQIGRPA
jgi:hypothetical protein